MARTARRAPKKKPRPQRGEFWKPLKKGESVGGEITKMDIISTIHGELAVVEIDTGDGTVAVPCGAVLGPELYDEFDVGDEVEVVFKGWEELEGGNKRKNFKVYDLNEDDDEEDDDEDDDE